MNKKAAHEDIHPNVSNYRFLGFRSYLLLFSESRYHLSGHTDRGRTQEFKVVFFFGWQTGSAFPLTLAQIIFRLRLQLAEPSTFCSSKRECLVSRLTSLLDFNTPFVIFTFARAQM